MDLPGDESQIKIGKLPEENTLSSFNRCRQERKADNRKMVKWNFPKKTKIRILRRKNFPGKIVSAIF